MEFEDKKQAVFNYILTQLQQEGCTAGTPLGMVQELAEKFGLSRYHVQQALSELYNTRLIVCKKRGGLLAARTLSENERDKLQSMQSNNVLIINHISKKYPWHAVHINDTFFSAFIAPVEKAGFNICFEELPPNVENEQMQNLVQKMIQTCTPRAVLVIIRGRHFDLLEEYYYLQHPNVFVFTRTGFSFLNGLVNTIGIANTLDGAAAAEAAFASGAKNVIFCHKSSVYVQQWQLERRNGIQLYLRKRADSLVFVNDFHFSGSFPLNAPSPETALIAHNDELAADMIDAGRLLGFEPGRDYKIIGFGDDPRYQEYKLTTMRPDLERIGRELAGAVINSSSLREPHSVKALLVPSLLVKRSTC